MKNTIKALFRSAIVCLFCVSLLTGSSYAWYTTYADGRDGDGASLLNEDGQVEGKAAQLSFKEDFADSWEVVTSEGANESARAIFSYNFWEPGYAQIRYVKLDNVGTDPLQYFIRVTELEKTSADIAKMIDVYLIEDISSEVDRADVAAATPVGTLAEVFLKSRDNDGVAHGTIGAGGNMTAAVVLKMKENAGNEYQSAYNKFNITISLSAFEISNVTQ